MLTKTSFPFLTPALLESDGQGLLDQGAVVFPESAPIVRVISAVLPLIESAAAAKQLIQSVCDEVNKITGATPPA